jgi:hypothetical protein
MRQVAAACETRLAGLGAGSSSLPPRELTGKAKATRRDGMPEQCASLVTSQPTPRKRSNRTTSIGK